MQQPETNKRPDDTPVELTIEKWVYGGEGLARLDGRVILVPRVLPGEVVRVEIGTGKSGMLRAGLVEVTTPSERRIEPPCPYFGRCGGCHYQHADYALQTEQKVSVLREVLRRIGKIEALEQIGTVAGEPWNYRNRAQFHLEHGQLGYLEAGSHKLCAIDHCPISSPQLNEVIGILREMMQDRRWPRFIKTLEVFTNENDVQVNVLDSERPVARWFFDWCAERIPGAAAGALEYETSNDKYRVGHRSFFQVNRFLVDALIETALGDSQGGTALDLYAGVGLFSIPLARRFEKVVAVESGASAVNDLQFNALLAKVSIDSQRSTVDDFLETAQITPDFVLADPPRAGLDKRNVRNLIRLHPPSLTIVACDPATLARDLAPLLAAGYSIQRMKLLDLFPQTYHFETVVNLKLGS